MVVQIILIGDREVFAGTHAQRALGREDFSTVEGLRVRMALHAGNAHERDGDYFGPAVNRVARVLAVGHGGQVLLSEACAELIGGLLPECSLRDLGEHRLKDLTQPERIHQLLAPDLIADFPPLRSLEHLSNNLPAPVPSFIGREIEIAEITALIEQHRLVTLVGSGGVGKTRLSLQVAAELLDGSGDGVWFIELAPLKKGEYIPTTVASALSITLPSEGDPVENLARALKGKKLLLVFDNCEHLVEPAVHVISAILRAAPKIKVLASSRQGLGVAATASSGGQPSRIAAEFDDWPHPVGGSPTLSLQSPPVKPVGRRSASARKTGYWPIGLPSGSSTNRGLQMLGGGERAWHESALSWRLVKNRRRRHRPPTGTVTFLFSDIEGSTVRWERRGACTSRCADARSDGRARCVRF